MAIFTHAKSHFNQLVVILIFDIRAWRTTEKVGPDRVKFTVLSRSVRIWKWIWTSTF